MRLIPVPTKSVPYIVKKAFRSDDDMRDEYCEKRKVTIVHVNHELRPVQFVFIGGDWYRMPIQPKTDQWFTSHTAIKRLEEFFEQRKQRQEVAALRRKLGVRPKKRFMKITDEKLHWHRISLAQEYAQKLRH